MQVGSHAYNTHTHTHVRAHMRIQTGMPVACCSNYDCSHDTSLQHQDQDQMTHTHTRAQMPHAHTHTDGYVYVQPGHQPAASKLQTNVETKRMCRSKVDECVRVCACVCVGPSFFLGLSGPPGKSPNPLKQVLDAVGESVTCKQYDKVRQYRQYRQYITQHHACHARCARAMATVHVCVRAARPWMY